MLLTKEQLDRKLVLFNGYYDELYNSPLIEISLKKLVDRFDEFIDTSETFKELVGEFNQHRKDCIASDRECIAFMLAFSME